MTLDNWAFSGCGDNVIAIYDQNGKLIKKYGLAEIVPASLIPKMTHHETSIWWRGDSIIDENNGWLVTQVWQQYQKVPYKKIKIDLRSGKLL